MHQLQTTSAYQIYGITLSSSQPLPMLVPAAAPAAADVEVYLTERELSSTHQDERGNPSGWYRKQKVNGVYYCLSLCSREARLDVEIALDGKQIWITWARLPLAEVTAILIGCIIGTALRLQGKLCLHSSVIGVDNYAVAIMGAKGAGKSTTAAALAKQGYPILADDVAVLAEDGDTFLIQPGYPRLRLWKSAVNALYGSEKGLTRVFQDTDKYFLELSQNPGSMWRFCPQPLPLAAIYVLGERQHSLAAPSLEAIIPQIGLMHLTTHRYPQTLRLDRSKQAREFAALGRLAAAVPMRSLYREENLARLSDVGNLILADAAYQYMSY